MTPLTIDKIIYRNEDRYLFGQLGDGYVLMDKEKGDIVNVNATASVIWTLAVEPVSIDRIIEHLMQEYKVEKALCEAETLTCITTMVDAGLIKIAE